MFLHITDMCKTRVVPQKKAVFRLDSPALAALCCSTDTNRSTTGLTEQISSSFMLLEQHRTPETTTELNFISDKRKKKGKG